MIVQQCVRFARSQLELRTGSDDITSNRCGSISSHLYLFKSIDYCVSVQSVSCNCCLDELEICC